LNSINKHLISIKRRIWDNPSYRHWNISNYKLVLENCSFQYCLLTDVNIDALFTLSKQHGYQ